MEKKETVTITMLPSIKEIGKKQAKKVRRSFSQYIEELIIEKKNSES